MKPRRIALAISADPARSLPPGRGGLFAPPPIHRRDVDGLSRCRRGRNRAAGVYAHGGCGSARQIKSDDAPGPAGQKRSRVLEKALLRARVMD